MFIFKILRTEHNAVSEQQSKLKLHIMSSITLCLVIHKIDVPHNLGI